MSAVSSQHDQPAVDLTNCDREPIHTPGSIQPHGLLCAVGVPALTIISISGNIVSITQHKPDIYVGRNLDSLLTSESVEQVRHALEQDDLAPGNPHVLHLAHAPQTEWNGILHQNDGLVFLELEPPDDHASYRGCFGHVRALSRQLHGIETLFEACAATAREVRRITGFDMVVAYRFLPDASGEVIAEDRDDSMPSYVGLRFPASDIPAQARALYVRNPSRNIPDADYVPAPLVPSVHPDSGEPIDLSLGVLRSVSPIHIEYLHNMGVKASMSFSIVRDGKLWGLVSCLNRRPRFSGYEIRQACELMAQALAWQVSVLEELEVDRHRSRMQVLQAQMVLNMEHVLNSSDAFTQHAETVLQATNASGAALWASGTLATVGTTPPAEEMAPILAWLAAKRPSDVFQTDRLPSLIPGAARIGDTASGLLAIPLSASATDVLLWFRPELPKTVQWGGNPHKAATEDAGRLHPRRSFAAWSEQVTGQSRPWAPHEIAAALKFRDLVVDAIVRRSQDLERTSSAIQIASDRLNTFIQVASHDLLEPARQVSTLTEILQSVMPEEAAADVDVAEILDGIRGVSGRLRRLIGDLADYSRVNRQADPLEPVDLDEIVQEVRSDLMPRINEVGARITAQSLPTVVCDRRQIRHVLLNLFSNALKYRDSVRPLLIRIYADDATPETAPVQAPETASERMVSICVEDNGIGFDEQYAETIFEPFRRLHGSSQYEGTGVGLAICRKIVERHGGKIRAGSTVGSGSTFCFTLPARASYPLNA